MLKQQGLALRDGLTTLDLARSIQFAIRGDNELKLDLAMLDEVTRVVRLIALGALRSEDPTSRSVKKPPASHRAGSRKSRSSR